MPDALRDSPTDPPPRATALALSAGAENADPVPFPATRLVRLAAAIPVAIGAAYLAAWLVGLGAAWSAAGVITMKTNMALAQVLAGSALLLLNGPGLAPWRRPAVTAASAFVLLLGLATLAEHLLDLDLGIDQLLAREPPGAAATVSPNRIGPLGSASLALLGSGLLALAWHRRGAVAAGLATSLMVVVPAVGFLYGISPFYASPRLTGIAWPTVVGLLSLASGLVLAGFQRTDDAVLWRDDPGGLLLRRMLAPGALIPLVLGYLAVQGARQGLFDVAMGTGLLAMALILLFSLLLWRSADKLSAAAVARRRAAEQLAAEKERLAVTLRSIGDAVISTDEMGRVRVFNTVAEALTGWPVAEAVGRSFAEVFRIVEEQTRRPAPDPIERVLREGTVVGLANHTMLVARDGTERPIADSAAPIRSADGRIAGVVLVFRDQTEERRGEQALRESEAALREADRRKSDFLGVLSHELRNPLAPIRNSIHILDRAPAGSELAARAMVVIRRQTDHLTRLVDDLLDVTRIARGKIVLERTRLDLGAVVVRACEDQRSVYQERGVALEVEASQPVWIDGDETRMAQVVGNLLHNAAKFSDEGGAVAVRIAAVGGQAELRVKDGGIGMAEEFLGRLFEPFVQADGGLARTKGGLGLGLALVKALVELQGGTVRAASAGAGHGSEFVVRLPLAAAPQESAPAPGAAGANGPLEILVIEDNADAAETLAEVLRTEGHRVQVAGDGASGIAKAREHRPDVVFCDIGLPDVDGYKVARTLRSEAGLRAVRLIALTGYAQPADKAQATAAGFDGHLAKPPRLETLLEVLCKPAGLSRDP